MFHVRVSRPQCALIVHVMDEDVSLFKRHPSWDCCLVDNTIVISPGRAHERDCGCSLHWEHMKGQTHALNFRGPRVEEIPFFGIFDTDADVDDTDIFRIRLDEAWRLPWIKPFRPWAWTQGALREFISQRVRSAVAAGHNPREALKLIAIPDIVREGILPATWNDIVQEYR